MCDDAVVAGVVVAAAAPALTVFEDNAESLPGDGGVDCINDDDTANLLLFLLGEPEQDVVKVGSGGGGGVGVLRAAAAFSAFAAAASKNSNDERQCLIFFLDRVDEADIFVLAGVIGGGVAVDR